MMHITPAVRTYGAQATCRMPVKYGTCTTSSAAICSGAKLLLTPFSWRYRGKCRHKARGRLVMACLAGCKHQDCKASWREGGRMIQPRQCKSFQKTTRVFNPLESSRQQGSGLPATTECGSTCLCGQVSPKLMSVMLSCRALPSAQDMLPNLEGRKIHRGASLRQRCHGQRQSSSKIAKIT